MMLTPQFLKRRENTPFRRVSVQFQLKEIYISVHPVPRKNYKNAIENRA